MKMYANSNRTGRLVKPQLEVLKHAGKRSGWWNNQGSAGGSVGQSQTNLVND